MHHWISVGDTEMDAILDLQGFEIMVVGKDHPTVVDPRVKIRRMKRHS